MLENIPEKEPFTLGELINCRKYQVCSQLLCCNSGASLTLLAFDCGEGESAVIPEGTMHSVSCTGGSG